jgi:hypothetical protein
MKQVIAMFVVLILALLSLTLLEDRAPQRYTCEFHEPHSSTEVLCWDEHGALFKLFKRAPGKFTVVVPRER